RLVLLGMYLLQFRILGNGFRDFRIVLHRATPERIDSKIYRKVLLRETRIVANHFRLRNLRQWRQPISQKGFWNVMPGIMPDDLPFDVAGVCWSVACFAQSRSLCE